MRWLTTYFVFRNYAQEVKRLPFFNYIGCLITKRGEETISLASYNDAYGWATKYTNNRKTAIFLARKE